MYKTKDILSKSRVSSSWLRSQILQTLFLREVVRVLSSYRRYLYLRFGPLKINIFQPNFHTSQKNGFPAWWCSSIFDFSIDVDARCSRSEVRELVFGKSILPRGRSSCYFSEQFIKNLRTSPCWKSVFLACVKVSSKNIYFQWSKSTI